MPIDSQFLGNDVYVNDDCGDGVTLTTGRPLFTDDGKLINADAPGTRKMTNDIFLTEEVIVRLQAYLQVRAAVATWAREHR